MKTIDIPNAYRIKAKIRELNARWKLKLTTGEAEGIQTSLKDSQKEQIQRLRSKGDGTNIGKTLKVVNFTYTILNEKENAMNEKGNYVLAIIKTKKVLQILKLRCPR